MPKGVYDRKSKDEASEDSEGPEIVDIGPRNPEGMPQHFPVNDPKGRIYFFRKEDEIYLHVQNDAKNIIERKMREQDKKDYSGEWRAYEGK